DEVVEAGVTPGAYAEALLVLLGLLRRSARSSGPALAIAGRRELARRIESLVDASRLRQRLSRRATASITVVALFGAGALSSISLAEPSAMTGGDAPAGVPPCCDGAMPIVAGAVGLALDSAFASMARDGFAGTVLVEYRGEVVFAKGFGLADRARRTPNRVTTRYHVAGITKVFTAAVTLALVDRALIELDAPVSRYLPELRGSVADVTIHQLLIHTDGLSDVHERHRPTSSSAFIRALNASSPAFRAGQSYGPGNAGHSLLALVVERIARQPFERVLREWMMQPAGMTSSFLRWEAGVSMDSVALGYVRDGPADPVTPGPDVWGVRGSRGLVTTVGDLHRWYMAYVTGRLVSRRSIESMRTPHVTTSKAFHQGYGWLLYDEGSTEPFRAGPAGLVRRSGRESGYEAELVHDIGGDWVAIVLVNSDALLRLRAIEAIRAVANAQPPPRVASP
ncbi:MAG TPA: serine hydrolase domain-containing protein, partial [Gemmatimonadaceae bacterium]|nr:serine hydrolase domain-containing protein [Gemmatimonadaceae bacterium]